jgi:SAM-dependent methyltransferase
MIGADDVLRRLASGERFVPEVQAGEPLAAGHLARYEFARSQIRHGESVLDLACGVGYGAQMLSAAGGLVTGVDRDNDAVAYARHATGGNVVYACRDFFDDAPDVIPVHRYDAVVSFETIEHLPAPLPVTLARLAALAGRVVIGSVPLHEWPGNRFHCHFEIDERDLQVCGRWGRLELYYQGPDGQITREAVAGAQNLIFLLHRNEAFARSDDVLIRQRRTSAPHVSVIVPVSDDAVATCAALDSLLREDRATVQTVAVDCSATPQSVLLLERYARVLPMFSSTACQGADTAAAIAAGLSHCSSPYVTWLLPGTALRADWLTRACATLDADPAVDAVAGGVIAYDDTVGFRWDWRPRPGRRSGALAVVSGQISQAAVLLRARAFDPSDLSLGGEGSLLALLSQASLIAATEGPAVLEWRTARAPQPLCAEPARAPIVPPILRVPSDSGPQAQQDAVRDVLQYLLGNDLASAQDGTLAAWWCAFASFALGAADEGQTHRRECLARWAELAERLTSNSAVSGALKKGIAAASSSAAHTGMLGLLPSAEEFGLWWTSSPSTGRASAEVRAGTRPLVIWGAAAGGQLVRRVLPRGQVTAFIDADPAKQGTVVDGLPVVSPDSVSARSLRPFVVVASTAAPQIVSAMTANGWQAGHDFVVADLTFAHYAGRR